jgi:S1-C subfamily serine protease
VTDIHEPGEFAPRPIEPPLSYVTTPRPRASLPPGRLVVLVVVAALVGAGASAVVARSTGWGTQTVVQRYVANTSSITERPADIQHILLKVLPSVVSITSTSTQSNPFFGPGSGATITDEGTGIALSADGEIITNDHVVSGASSITVTLNGSTNALPATVVGADAAHDLALLKVSGVSNLPVPVFGDSSKIVAGDDVIAVGYALGLTGGPTVTAGIISATGRQVSTQTSTGTSETLTDMLQTDAAISSGNSGGPLVNASGQVVGINTIVATSNRQNAANGIGFAIAANTITSVLPSLGADR